MLDGGSQRWGVDWNTRLLASMMSSSGQNDPQTLFASQ